MDNGKGRQRERKFFGFGRNVFIAGLVSFFMDVGSEMIYPLVPLFLAHVLGANKTDRIRDTREATRGALCQTIPSTPRSCCANS